MATPQDGYNLESGLAGVANACSPPALPGICAVEFAVQPLVFAQSGRSYRVILQWPTSYGYFMPCPLTQQIHQPPGATLSQWSREDYLTGTRLSEGTSLICWTVYIPTNAGTAYAPLTLSVSATAIGFWTNKSQLTPPGTWTVSAPIP